MPTAIEKDNIDIDLLAPMLGDIVNASRQSDIVMNLYCFPIADIFKRNNCRYHIHADDTQRYAECPPP